MLPCFHCYAYQTLGMTSYWSSKLFAHTFLSYITRCCFFPSSRAEYSHLLTKTSSYCKHVDADNQIISIKDWWRKKIKESEFLNSIKFWGQTQYLETKGGREAAKKMRYTLYGDLWIAIFASLGTTADVFAAKNLKKDMASIHLPGSSCGGRENLRITKQNTRLLFPLFWRKLALRLDAQNFKARLFNRNCHWDRN